MLVELSVVEQRYHAVMEVVAGSLVTEVAARYEVSRKSVHAWLRRYEASGLAGLVDRSHRPRSHPGQLEPVTEARLVQLRIDHPRWGPRRLEFELARAGVFPVPSLDDLPGSGPAWDGRRPFAPRPASAVQATQMDCSRDQELRSVACQVTTTLVAPLCSSRPR